MDQVTLRNHCIVTRGLRPEAETSNNHQGYPQRQILIAVEEVQYLIPKGTGRSRSYTNDDDDDDDDHNDDDEYLMVMMMMMNI